LLLPCPPLKDGIWTNRYDGTFVKFHASTCAVDSVPLILPAANIVMNRRYDDGSKHIGWHSDDVKDLHELGLIVVLRTGRRAFQVRDKETQRMVFDRALEPVDLLIMTAHGSNLVTEHCVPKEDGATAASSSWTFRTSVNREEVLRKKMEKAQRDVERRAPKSR
jgi:hypothetical protein